MSVFNNRSHDIDYTTAHGARILVEIITDYWARRGAKVECRIETYGTGPGGHSDVRSDIGMYPPRGATLA